MVRILKIFFIFFIVMVFIALPTFSGEITGEIYYSDGSKCSSCRVSASINYGGVTDSVYCDSKGRFRLTWSSNNSIAKLFVNGNTVKKNIRNGEHVVVYLK
jgi:hypothetical protein